MASAVISWCSGKTQAEAGSSSHAAQRRKTTKGFKVLLKTCRKRSGASKRTRFQPQTRLIPNRPNAQRLEWRSNLPSVCPGYRVGRKATAVTDKPDSPQLLAPKVKARMYFGLPRTTT